MGLYHTEQAQDVPRTDGGTFTFVAGIPVGPVFRYMETDRYRDSIVTGPIGPDGGHDCIHSACAVDVFGPSSDVNHFAVVGLGGADPIGYCPSKDGKVFLIPQEEKPWGKKFSPTLCIGFSPAGTWKGTRWEYLNVEHADRGLWIVRHVYMTATTGYTLFGLFTGHITMTVVAYTTDREYTPEGIPYYVTTAVTYSGAWSDTMRVSDWNAPSYERSLKSYLSMVWDYAKGDIEQRRRARSEVRDVAEVPIMSTIFLQRPSDEALERVRQFTDFVSYELSQQMEGRFRDEIYTECPDLVKEAVKDVQFVDINTAMYLRDLPSLFGEVKEAVSLIKALKPLPKSILKTATSKRTLKRALKGTAGLKVAGKSGSSLKSLGRQMLHVGMKGSNLYLSAKYGTRLTVSDTEEIVKAYRRFARADGVLDFSSLANTLTRIKEVYDKAFCSLSSVVRARSKVKEFELDLRRFIDPPEVSKVKYQTNVSIRYHNRRQDAQPVLNFLRQIDLYPTAVNIWDAIPYSFVVDWFIPVEELLEQVDVWEQLSWLDISSYTKSLKATCTASFHLQNYGLSGLVLGDQLDYRVTFYQRLVTDQLDTPVWNTDEVIRNKSAKHVPELTALFVQRWGKLLASKLR